MGTGKSAPGVSATGKERADHSTAGVWCVFRGRTDWRLKRFWGSRVACARCLCWAREPSGSATHQRVVPTFFPCQMTSPTSPEELRERL
jgi:hypothetical protein